MDKKNIITNSKTIISKAAKVTKAAKSKCEKKTDFYYDQNNKQCIKVAFPGCKVSSSDTDKVDKEFIMNAQKKCVKNICIKRNTLLDNQIPYRVSKNHSVSDYNKIIENSPYMCITREQCFKNKYQIGNQCIDEDECKDNTNTNNIKCVQYTKYDNQFSDGNDLRIHKRTRDKDTWQESQYKKPGDKDTWQESQDKKSGDKDTVYNNLTWKGPQYTKKDNTTLQQCFDLCNNISNCKLFTYNKKYKTCALKYKQSTGLFTYVKKQL